MLDATGSIGLENDHELADVISFSSCKGLFGLTGAGFICFNKKFDNYIPSFYLNLQNHIDKKMTGPYQILYSLEKILEKHSDIKYSVIINKKKFMKKMKNFLTVNKENQPNLCTHVNKIIKSRSKKTILYSPRNTIGGSVVCHIGEAHLGKDAKGKILDLRNKGRAIVFELRNQKGQIDLEKTFDLALAWVEVGYFDNLILDYDSYDPSGELNAQIIIAIPEITNFTNIKFERQVQTLYNNNVQSNDALVEVFLAKDAF